MAISVKSRQGNFNLVITHPDGMVSEQRVHPGARMRMGRDPQCEIALRDVNVSRSHAELRESKGQLIIRDLKSLNGTRLNGQLILEAVVRAGDTLLLGECRIIVEAAEEAPEGQVRPPSGTVQTRRVKLEIIHAILLDSDNPSSSLASTKLTPMGTSMEEVRRNHRKLNQAYNKLLALMGNVAGVGRVPRGEQLMRHFLGALLSAYDTVQSAGIFSYREDQDLFTVAESDSQTGTEQMNFDSAMEELLRQSLLSSRSLYAVDTSNGKLSKEESDSRAARGGRSMMVAPVFVKGQPINFIFVENRNTSYCFDHFDLDLLTLFAFHLATAMENARLILDLDNAYDSASKLFQEVTEDKKAILLELQESEKRFRALFQQSGIGGAVINIATGRIDEINDALAEMLGYRKGTLSGKLFAEVVEDESRERAREFSEEVAKDGSGATELILHRAQGDQLIALINARVIQYGANLVMVCYVTDITARKRAEQETKLQLQRITALGEFSQILMGTLEPSRIYRLIFDKVSETIPTDVFAIALRESPGGPLRPVIALERLADGSISDLAQLPAQIREDSLSPVTVRREALLESIVPGDTSRLHNPFFEKTPLRFRTHSRLYVPLATRNEVIGILTAQAYATESYKPHELDFLISLATLTSLALQNASLFTAARDQEENLRRLSAQILTAQETERGRISRELHDGVGQSLTALRYHLESLRTLAKNLPDGTELNKGIRNSADMVRQVIEELRTISLDLRPTMLDDLGLQPTIEWLARDTSARFGVEITADVRLGPDFTVPEELASTIFRIAQEGINNAGKHAKATAVEITIERQRDLILMSIRDDGIGFESEGLPQWQVARGCSGILNIKERARLAGGTFQLETAPGKGTCLSFQIPVKEVAP